MTKLRTREAVLPRDDSPSPPEPVARQRRRRSWSASRIGDDLLRLAFLLPAIAYLALFFGYPVIKNVLMAFQDYTTSTFYTGEAPWVGLENYRDVVSDPHFRTFMVNTAVFTIGSIVFQFAFGMLLALFFQRRFPLSRLMRSVLLLPWLIPLIVSSAVWRWMLDKDAGVVNQVVGAFGGPASVGWLTDTTFALLTVTAVNIWLGIPFNMTILYGGLQEIPEELYEAAALDGATGARAFRYVTWPLLKPVVTVVLVLGVVYTLKVLDIILALTGGGPANSTQTLSTESYHLSFKQFEFGQGAAVGNVLIVISLVFALLYLRANRKAIDA